MTTMISESDFTEEWGAHTRDDGNLFSYDEVKDESINLVWTIIECDDGSWIASPGFHVVNKMGYVLTTKPWDDPMLDAMWFEDDLDAEDSDEDDSES